MSSYPSRDTIKDLLHEVTDDIEPGDRLDAIRAATAERGRRTRSSTWWAAGGVGLVAASVVTALALTTGGTQQVRQPEPAAPAPTTATDVRPEPAKRVPVYYVGETWAGLRLYREFRTVVAEGQTDPLTAAVDAAVGSAGDGSALGPLDPDYRSWWPEGTRASARVVPGEDRIEIDLTSLEGNDLSQPLWMTPEAAAQSVEALVRTAQGVVQERLPVRLLLDGQVSPTVLGVPTSEELATAPDLDVLAHVNISDPFMMQVVDNDEPFVVRGVGTGFEGNIVTRIERWDGTGGGEVVAELPTIASGDGSPRLWPYEVSFDLTDLPPGDYVVTSQTEDPSGAGEFYLDSRQITVVD